MPADDVPFQWIMKPPTHPRYDAADAKPDSPLLLGALAVHPKKTLDQWEDANGNSANPAVPAPTEGNGEAVPYLGCLGR